MRRVVITGIGVVSPLGIGLNENWEGLLQSRYPFEPVRRFDASPYGFGLVGEVSDARVRAALPDFKDWRRVDRHVPMSLAASREAIEQADLLGRSSEMAVVIGSGIGAIDTSEKLQGDFARRGLESVPPTSLIRLMHNSVASHTSLFFGAKRTHLALASACSSGASALQLAYQWIAGGFEDRVLAGGADATVTASHLSAWKNMRVLSAESNPAKACRPFDQERPGVLLSEGAASFVLESEESARRRGAKILAYFAAAASTSDAHHITAPSADGQFECMKDAIRQSGMSVDAIDYVNAHGSGSDLNDVTELESITRAFDGRHKKLFVSSTKGVSGHLLGAAGAFEAMVCVKALIDQRIPGMRNLSKPLPHADFIVLPQDNVQAPCEVALSNSFSFGGNNTTLVFKRA